MLRTRHTRPRPVSSYSTFFGKASIRYNKVTVDEQVFKYIKIFKWVREQQDSDGLFDYVNVSDAKLRPISYLPKSPHPTWLLNIEQALAVSYQETTVLRTTTCESPSRSQKQLDKGTPETGNMLTTTIGVPPIKCTISPWRNEGEGNSCRHSELPHSDSSVHSSAGLGTTA